MQHVARYELALSCAILVLIIFESLGIPLCAACFFNRSNESEELIRAREVDGVILAEPKVREKNIQALLHTTKGDALLFLNRYVPVAYGDRVKVKGTFQRPEAFDLFDYPRYLRRQGIHIVSYYPEVAIVAKGGDASLYAMLLRLKGRLRSPILERFGEPHGGLILAMTLGEQWRLTSRFQDVLARSGIIHIASISGLHISMISIGMFMLFIGVGFNRRSAFFVIVPFLILYILLIGFPASAVRSGIMGSMLLFAHFLGRSGKMLYALLLSAFVMLLWDTRWIHDIGFQLSFASLGALILILPGLNRWSDYFLRQYSPSDSIFSRVRQITVPILLASIAVSLALLPLSAYHFGQFSLVAPLTNIMILPLTPLFLGLALWVEISGVLWQPLWFVTEYMVRVAYFFANAPFASVSLTFAGWAIIPYYLLLFGGMYLLNRYFSFTWQDDRD